MPSDSRNKSLPSPSRHSKLQLPAIDAQIARAKLLLTRALKLAKAFERQKLGRRQKTADLSEASKDSERIVAEIKALKKLNVPLLAEHHLSKVLLRTKSVANSPLLPSTVRLTPYELDAAGKNVVARLYNARVVKETIESALGNIQAALGITTAVRDSKNTKSSLPDKRSENASSNGLKSHSRDLYKREANVANEEEQLGVESGSDNVSSSLSERLEPVTYNITNKSAFIPALTAGGYWSGSESQGDDDDDEMAAELAPRKNRRGQRARRQIWEKKYGSNAKHLREGKMGQNKSSWDPRRGAIQGRESLRWKDGKPSRPQHHTDVTIASRNTVPTKDENRQQTSRVPLHPSWEAAKKLKQQMKVPHQGTKIVFD